MSERSRFIHDCLSTEWSMAELCSRYNISRKTGYKWLNRFLEEGKPGLIDRPRTPLSCRHKTADHIVELIIEARNHHPSWGPKKLLAILSKKHPQTRTPGKTEHAHDPTQRDLDH